MKELIWSDEMNASDILNGFLEIMIENEMFSQNNLGALAFATGRVESMEE